MQLPVAVKRKYTIDVTWLRFMLSLQYGRPISKKRIPQSHNKSKAVKLGTIWMSREHYNLYKALLQDFKWDGNAEHVFRNCYLILVFSELKNNW